MCNANKNKNTKNILSDNKNSMNLNISSTSLENTDIEMPFNNLLENFTPDEISNTSLNFDSDFNNLNVEIPDMDFLDMDLITETSIKKKTSFSQDFISMFRELGFKNIFHDKIELLFLSIIGLIAIIFSLWFSFNSLPLANTSYSTTFFIAPLLYLILSLFSHFNSRDKGAIEIELTCKYNIYKLSAIRMFLFSILSIIINTVSLTILSYFNNQIILSKSIAVSINSLFIFSALFIIFITKVKKKYANFIFIGIWTLINAVLNIFYFSEYNKILFETPIYIHVGITILSLFVYLKFLKTYMKRD